MQLNYQHCGENTDADDLLITIITKYQLFEPCKYLYEDDDWISVAMISIEDEDISQAMSIKKSEITMFGIFDRDEIEITKPKSDSEVFYQ